MIGDITVYIRVRSTHDVESWNVVWRPFDRSCKRTVAFCHIPHVDDDLRCSCLYTISYTCSMDTVSLRCYGDSTSANVVDLRAYKIKTIGFNALLAHLNDATIPSLILIHRKSACFSFSILTNIFGLGGCEMYKEYLYKHRNPFESTEQLFLVLPGQHIIVLTMNGLLRKKLPVDADIFSVDDYDDGDNLRAGVFRGSPPQGK